MIICMYEIICVTNRNLCKDDFLTRLSRISALNPKAVILREKDLTEDDYCALAEKAADICSKNNTALIMHTYYKEAQKLGCRNIHLPLHLLREMSDKDKEFFNVLGASCHSVNDAVEAETLGCTYIIAGHIFDTDCKKGLPGRGLDFLRDVCKRVKIPVYAIGGINDGNIRDILACGAKGGCIMSSIMTANDVGAVKLLTE